MLGIIDCSSILQNMHNYSAGGRSVVVSRVYFTLTIPTRAQHFLFVEISQPYGTDFEEYPLEVSRPYVRKPDELPTQPLTPPHASPEEHKGAYNHNEISDGIEQYYRSQVGQSGSGIRIGSGSSNITMTNNRFIAPFQFTVNLEEHSHVKSW